MKKYFMSLAAATLLAFSAAASAQAPVAGGFYVDNPQSFAPSGFNPSDDLDLLNGFNISTASFGTLRANVFGEGVTLNAEYVGKEAAWKNFATFYGNVLGEFGDSAVLGTGAGQLIDFSFGSENLLAQVFNVDGPFGNGTSNRFLIVLNEDSTSALLMFNDFGSKDKDFDDYVFRIDATGDFGISNPIPEPGTYALLLAGLAAIGFTVRRRASVK